MGGEAGLPPNGATTRIDFTTRNIEGATTKYMTFGFHNNYLIIQAVITTPKTSGARPRQGVCLT